MFLSFTYLFGLLPFGIRGRLGYDCMQTSSDVIPLISTLCLTIQVLRRSWSLFMNSQRLLSEATDRMYLKMHSSVSFVYGIHLKRKEVYIVSSFKYLSNSWPRVNHITLGYGRKGPSHFLEMQILGLCLRNSIGYWMNLKCILFE